jgi:hypothetical protein
MGKELVRAMLSGCLEITIMGFPTFFIFIDLSPI